MRAILIMFSVVITIGHHCVLLAEEYRVPECCYLVLGGRHVDVVEVEEIGDAVYLNGEKVESSKTVAIQEEFLTEVMSDPEITKHYALGTPTREEAKNYIAAVEHAMSVISGKIPARLNSVINDPVYIAMLSTTVDSIQAASPGLIRSLYVDKEYGAIHVSNYIYRGSVSHFGHMPYELAVKSDAQRMHEFFSGLENETQNAFIFVCSGGAYELYYGDDTIREVKQHYELLLRNKESVPGRIPDYLHSDIINVAENE